MIDIMKLIEMRAKRESRTLTRTKSSLSTHRFNQSFFCVVIALSALWTIPSALLAQSAYFNGATTTLSTPFTQPTSVAMDSSGNLYVADGGNGSVTKILASDGTATPIATSLAFPLGIALDNSGNVYVADYAAGSIVEIPAAGGAPITLVSGLDHPQGIAVDTNGNIYVSRADGKVLEALAVDGSIPAAPTIQSLGAGFNGPEGIAVDSGGNVYVADVNNNRIVVMPPNCTDAPCVTSLVTGLQAAEGVAIDAKGNLFFSDKTANTLSEMLAVNGVVSSASTTRVVASNLNRPIGIATDKTGNIYVANYGGGNISKVMLSALDFGTVDVGSATPTSYSLQFTFTGAGTIQAPLLLTSGASGLDFKAGTPGSSPCASRSYSIGESCTVAVDFNPLYPGARYGAVQLVDGTGTPVASVYTVGTGHAPQIVFDPPRSTPSLGSGLSNPSGIAVDGSGNVYIADSTTNSLVRLPAGGGTPISLGGGFAAPMSVAVDGAGNIFVADSASNSVKMLAPGCTSVGCVALVASSFNTPGGVAVDGKGNVYVADTGNNLVKEIIAVDGSIPASPSIVTLGGTFTSPKAVAVDGDGNVYVAETGNDAVKEIVALNGSIPASPTVISLGGTFSAPSGIAVDGVGEIYVANTGSGLVTKMSPGCASSACASNLGHAFTSPVGVAVDATGNVYVADSAAATVTQLAYASAPSLGFGTVKAGQTSPLQTIAVQNIGNADLSLSTAFDSSSVASGTFSLDGSSTCAAPGETLAALQQCTYEFSFTPALGQSYTGAFTATDNNLNTAAPGLATQTVDLAGIGEALVFGSTALADGTVGVAITPQTLQVSGGSGTYTYAATGLPAGLSLASSGTLSGTPSQGGAFTSIEVTATDTGNGISASTTLSMTINAPVIMLNAATLPNAIYNTSYSQSLPAPTGGTAPYSYSLQSGTLPPGLSLDASGIISGIPTSSGTYSSLVIEVTDASTGTGPYTSTQTYSITVEQAIPSITINNLPSSATYNGSFTPSFTYSGSDSPAESVASSTSSVCIVSSGVVHFVGVGTCTLTASAASTANYQAVSGSMQSFSVRQDTQSITFDPPSSLSYGTQSVDLSPTGGSSGLPVTLTIVSGPGSLSGNTLSILAIGTISIKASQAGSADYAAAPDVVRSVVITPAELTASANSISRAYGLGNPTFTGSVNGAVNGDVFTEAFSTSATLTSHVGMYAIVPSLSGAGLSNYNVHLQSGTMTIVQAATTVVLAASNQVLTPGQSVTLTAQVSSATTGTPSGTVSFYNAGALLGTSVLSSGTASLSVSSFSPGTTNSVTATYSGEGDFAGSATSSATSITVSTLDFALTNSGSAGPTINAGDSAAFQFKVVPTYGTYPGAVTFSASGLPTGASVSFSPPSVAADGGPQTVTMTVQTAATAAKNSGNNGSAEGRNRFSSVALTAVLLLGVGGIWSRRRGLQSLLYVVLVLVSGGAIALTGCVSHSSNSGSSAEPHTYTILLTAASGGIQHTSSLSLTVK